MPTFNGTPVEDLTDDNLLLAYARACTLAYQAAEHQHLTDCETNLTFARHILAIRFGVALSALGNTPDGEAADEMGQEAG